MSRARRRQRLSRRRRARKREEQSHAHSVAPRFEPRIGGTAGVVVVDDRDQHALVGAQLGRGRVKVGARLEELEREDLARSWEILGGRGRAGEVTERHGRSAEVIREAMGGHRRHGWEPCLRASFPSKVVSSMILTSMVALVCPTPSVSSPEVGT